MSTENLEIQNEVTNACERIEYVREQKKRLAKIEKDAKETLRHHIGDNSSAIYGDYSIKIEVEDRPGLDTKRLKPAIMRALGGLWLSQFETISTRVNFSIQNHSTKG